MMWDKIKNLFRSFYTGSDHPLADDTMLTYFLSMIDVRTKLLEPLIANDPLKLNLLTEVRSRLESFNLDFGVKRKGLVDSAWNEAYRLERLLALIEPANTLIGELQRRVDEAVDEAVPSAPRLRKQFEAVAPLAIDTTQSPPTLKPGGEPLLRAILLDVLEETHWTFQRKFHSRPIQKNATSRLVWIGLFACFLFLLPYIYLYISLWLGGSTTTLPFENWAWLPLWTALTSGFFGAIFSRLLFLQANWNVLSLGALKDARDYTSILLRGCVGMSGAVVVYYFLLSGVLSGGLFPQFDEIGLHQLRFPNPIAEDKSIVPLRLILPNASLALLVVWSFLAGFSERLVPSILQSTENSLREPREKSK